MKQWAIFTMEQYIDNTINFIFSNMKRDIITRLWHTALQAHTRTRLAGIDTLVNHLVSRNQKLEKIIDNLFKKCFLYVSKIWDFIFRSQINVVNLFSLLSTLYSSIIAKTFSATTKTFITVKWKVSSSQNLHEGPFFSSSRRIQLMRFQDVKKSISNGLLLQQLIAETVSATFKFLYSVSKRNLKGIVPTSATKWRTPGKRIRTIISFASVSKLPRHTLMGILI